MEERLEVETDDNSISISEYRKNWRQLREGMKMDEVEELLGSPQSVDGGSSATWHYYMGGRVYFNDRGRLSSWSEPY